MQTGTISNQGLPHWRQGLLRAAAIAAAAALLIWPAIVNGFPILFPDTLEYLWQSKGILGKLRGHDVPYWWYGAKRSEIYSASLAFLHHGAALWPIVIVQAVLTAWIIWLVVRAFQLPRPFRAYLLIASGLSMLTGVAWYVSSLMPDILGALMYLAFFLLVVTPGTLQRWESALLAVVSFWSITAHATHLLLAGGLCALFAALWSARWPGVRGQGRRLLFFAAIVALGIAAQLTVHQRLYGRATVFGRPPAFLMARLLADGPARQYLQQHCGTSHWLLCQHVNNIPSDGEVFLWSEGGVWMHSDLAQQAELRSEQTPLLIATLKAYPLQQLKRSLANVGQSLITLGPWDYWNFATATPYYMEMTVPGLTEHYAATRQSHNALPQSFSRNLQIPMVTASLVLIAFLLPAAWRRRDYTTLNLAAVVLFTVLANAFVTGMLSGVFPRYQGRVAWMLVLLAALMTYSAIVTRKPMHATLPEAEMSSA